MSRDASAFRRAYATWLRAATLAVACSLAAPRLQAQEALQPLEDLRRIAEAFVTQQATSLAPETPASGTTLHVQAATLDPRLRLPACASRPVASLAPGASLAARSTIGLRCAQPSWAVYVSVTVESEIPVLVAKHAAERGAALTSADVERQTRRVPGFAARYLGDIATLKDRHLRAAIAAGTPLGIELFAADVMVRRGQRVTLLAAVSGIEVRAQGQALADSRADGRVRVQNLASLRVVEGKAESADLVRVTP